MEVITNGSIVYSEVVRENICKLQAYIEEMVRDHPFLALLTFIQKVQANVLKILVVVKSTLSQLIHVGPRQESSFLITVLASTIIFWCDISLADKVPFLHLER